MPAADVYRIRSGGGPLALFGLPFLIVGLTFVSLYLHTPTGWTTSGEPWVAAVLGGVFAVVGGLMVFGRAGVDIDRGRGTVVTWWGLLAPLHSTQTPLSRVNAVGIDREIHRTKNGSYVSFPVCLEGEGLHIQCHDARDYPEMRRKAEALAKFLTLGLRDRSTGEEVVREAGTLDESVLDRARRLHAVTPLPPQPPGATCHLEYSGPHTVAVIGIPPAGAGPLHQAGLLGALGFSAFIGYQLFGNAPWKGAESPDGFFIGVFALFFVALPVGFALFAMLDAARSNERVSVSDAGLRAEYRGPFRSKTIDLATAEIEEVETSGTGTVVVRCDRLSCELGSSLSRAEQEWLRDMIVHVLTADAGAGSTKAAPQAPQFGVQAAPAPAVRAPISLGTKDAPPLPGQPAAGPRPSNRGFAVSLAGIAALVFVLYQNGALKNLFPAQLDQPSAPGPQAATADRAETRAPRPPVAATAAARTQPGGAPTDVDAQRGIEAAEKEHGPDHPAVAAALYRAGLRYQQAKRPRDQEQAWLRALSILQKYPGAIPKKYYDDGFDGSVDKEVIARGLGDLYWEQYRYTDSYTYYDLAYRLSDDVPMDEVERNRRLASDSAGIMASACVLKKWEIADYAMQELKDRIKTVIPDEQKRLEYWVRTGEPRLKARKC